MSFQRSSGTSLASLLSLVLLYLLLIALVLVFADQLLTDLAFSRSFSTVLLIALAGIFPAFLLGSIVWNLVRLARDRREGRPGVRFKVRLLAFFFLVVFLSSVPQAVLSVNFINAALNSWFSDRTGEALRGGLDTAFSYFDELSQSLRRFTSSPFYEEDLLPIAVSNPRSAWSTIESINPVIDAMQVYSPAGEELFFAGPPELGLRPQQALNAPPGQVASESSENADFLRIVSEVPAAEGTYAVILSIQLPTNFDDNAEALTGSLETFTQLERLRAVFLRAVIAFYAVFSVPLLLLALLVSFVLSDEVIRPLVNLEDATRRVSEGDFSFRILSRSGDDLSLLVNSFNQMVSELERTRKKIIQTEKVAAWQEIAQRLAHEIKNPLTPIRLAAERLRRKYYEAPEDFEQVLESSIRSITNEVEGLNQLLSEFRNFSRLPEPHPQKLKLEPLVREVAALYASPEIPIHTDSLDPAITVGADPAQLRQVFVNLIRNAVEAIRDSSGSGSIFVRADLVSKGKSSYCRIQVQDTGPGIAPERQDQVFNPYFTTKVDGTGLGLAVVERIIFDHNGQMWFETEPGLGSTFFLDLPAEPM
jgi:nitrogen fixation/metabolism regulation signal transduction histidine kinase